jgi:hypothetical protein
MLIELAISRLPERGARLWRDTGMLAQERTADWDYFLRRAREERAKADACQKTEARAAHLELFQEYTRRAKEIPAFLCRAKG